MTCKIIYSNNSFEYFYDIKSIHETNSSFVLTDDSRNEFWFDKRLKIEVTM